MRPVIAPSNLPLIDKSAMNTCLDSFYGSTAGKVVNFFSPLSMVWGPEKLGSAADWFVFVPAKYGAVQAGLAAGGASLRSLETESPISSWLVDWAAGKAAAITEGVAKFAGLETLGAATAVDITAHVGCAYSGSSQASQGLVNETIDPYNVVY